MRETHVSDDQANKATHSYTITPVISRDGKMTGKLLICLKEDKGEFGPRVGPKVSELANLFGNIDVIASSSGKMSVKLMEEWVGRGLLPPILDLAKENPPPARNEPQEPQPSCSWQEVQVECPDRSQQGSRQLQPTCPTSPPPTALILADSWGGNINKDVQAILKSGSIHFMQIPPGTTNDLQPCDVEIFRQWKYLARRLTMQAYYDGFIGALTSRAGVLNMQSLIFNQFSAPAYQDLIRYSWRHIDRNFSTNELSSREFRTIDLQFSFRPGSICDHEDCEAFAFIKWAHCGRLLCAKHFFERRCFHEADEEDAEEIEFDDDFDTDLRD